LVDGQILITFLVLSKQQRAIVDAVKKYLNNRKSNELRLSQSTFGKDRKFVAQLASDLGLYCATVGSAAAREMVISRHLPKLDIDSSEEDVAEAASRDDSDEESEDEESFFAQQRVLRKYDNMHVAGDEEQDAETLLKRKMDSDFVEQKRL
jgi:hypothetical protein